MKIKEIYRKYQIPENLQQHMYRVAAVGRTVVDFLDGVVELDKDLITTVLLLHDMGNILKFDLDNRARFSEEESKRLERVRQEFISKYGNGEHVVTIAIAKELGVSDQAIGILENIGSSRVHLTIQSSDWYKKICSYADFRVAPYGVVSIEERFGDVIKRYRGRDHVLADIEETERKKKDCLVLEKQIQEKASLPLSGIDDLKIRSKLGELSEYEI